MPRVFAVEPISSRAQGDRPLLAAVFLLAGTGFAALWSASAGYAISLGRTPHYFILRQAINFLPALLAFGVCAFLPLEIIREKMGLITLASLIFLALPFVPGLGENRNGASRWIDISITTLQPSEFWKPVSILYLSHVLDKRKDRIEREPRILIPPFLMISLGALVIFLQNDFSTAAISFASGVVILWIAGAPSLFFAGIAGLFIPLGALIVLTSDFRLKRILTFLFPAYEPHGQGYQMLGSLRAIKSGGFFGKGIGLGTLKLGSVPAVQSDFIFAAWSEETGFLGVLAFFALWGLLAFRAFRNSFSEGPGFRSWLGFGLTSLLLMETLINVAVAAGVIPATGIALPFFSAGGSSLISTTATCGLLLNLSKPIDAPFMGRREGDRV